MIKSLFFLLRIVAAWMLLFLLAAALWSSLPLIGHMEGPIVFASGITLAFVLTGAFSHLRRVRLIAGNIDNGALNNRQRRQVEIPFEAGEAFDLLDAAIRELPRIERVESARDSLQVRAKLATPQPYGERPFGRWNPLEWFGTGRNQIQGAVVMGIGMALFEHTSYDPQNGAPINSNLADYVMAVNADAPPIEVHFLDFPDTEINELGSRGIGEIGLAGFAAAVTAAVHHATGIRVRELPVKIENLLT